MKNQLLVVIGAIVILAVGIGGFVWGSRVASKGQDKVQAARDSAVVEAVRWRTRFEEAKLQYEEQRKLTEQLVLSMETLKVNLVSGRKQLGDAIARNDTAYIKNIILWNNARVHPAPAAR